MITAQLRDDLIPAARISDSDTMTNKLIYQIRTGRMSNIALDRLQARCTSELHQLRAELDKLLEELRLAAQRISGQRTEKKVAA